MPHPHTRARALIRLPVAHPVTHLPAPRQKLNQPAALARARHPPSPNRCVCPAPPPCSPALFLRRELCGRPLCVDRPAGYTPDMSRPLPVGMLEQGMPTGGSGAPPEKSAAALAATNALKMAVGATGVATPAIGGAIGVGGLPPAIGGAPVAPPPPPSRLLCLKNLLTAEALSNDDEFKECADDIKEECGSFGAVTFFCCPRPSDLQGYAESDVGSCFVRFELLSAAVKAQLDLHGREFDGQRVSAVFVQEGAAAEGAVAGGALVPPPPPYAGEVALPPPPSDLA